LQPEKGETYRLGLSGVGPARLRVGRDAEGRAGGPALPVRGRVARRLPLVEDALCLYLGDLERRGGRRAGEQQACGQALQEVEPHCKPVCATARIREMGTREADWVRASKSGPDLKLDPP